MINKYNFCFLLFNFLKKIKQSILILFKFWRLPKFQKALLIKNKFVKIKFQ
jgi:hypothetical protein